MEMHSLSFSHFFQTPQKHSFSNLFWKDLGKELNLLGNDLNHLPVMLPNLKPELQLFLPPVTGAEVKPLEVIGYVYRETQRYDCSVVYTYSS